MMMQKLCLQAVCVLLVLAASTHYVTARLLVACPMAMGNNGRRCDMATSGEMSWSQNNTKEGIFAVAKEKKWNSRGELTVRNIETASQRCVGFDVMIQGNGVLNVWAEPPRRSRRDLLLFESGNYYWNWVHKDADLGTSVEGITFEAISNGRMLYLNTGLKNVKVMDTDCETMRRQGPGQGGDGNGGAGQGPGQGGNGNGGAGPLSGNIPTSSNGGPSNGGMPNNDGMPGNGQSGQAGQAGDAEGEPPLPDHLPNYPTTDPPDPGKNSPPVPGPRPGPKPGPMPGPIPRPMPGPMPRPMPLPPMPENPYVLEDVRLAGGQSMSAGRVEVKFRGTWGSVCQDGWTDITATVVCNQLGLGTGKVLRNAYFGQGNGPILLDGVRCPPFARSLDMCCYNEIGVHNCDHTQDVSVRCTRCPNGEPACAPCPAYKTDGSCDWNAPCDHKQNPHGCQVPPPQCVRHPDGTMECPTPPTPATLPPWPPRCFTHPNGTMECPRPISPPPEPPCFRNQAGELVCLPVDPILPTLPTPPPRPPQNPEDCDRRMYPSGCGPWDPPSPPGPRPGPFPSPGPVPGPDPGVGVLPAFPPAVRVLLRCWFADWCGIVHTSDSQERWQITENEKIFYKQPGNTRARHRRAQIELPRRVMRPGVDCCIHLDMEVKGNMRFTVLHGTRSIMEVGSFTRRNVPVEIQKSMTMQMMITTKLEGKGMGDISIWKIVVYGNTCEEVKDLV